VVLYIYLPQPGESEMNFSGLQVKLPPESKVEASCYHN